MTRASLLLLGFSLSLGACVASTESADTGSNGSAAGKADGIGDEALCPAEVALNAGEGSAKRCYDTESGQFVASECCADVCEGASMRAQSNGERCAWTSEPGMAGARVGQFAPQLCCDLNDDLACGRATEVGGGCVDAETGMAVDAACCAPEPTACHPSVASAIDTCMYRLAESDAEEGLPVPSRTAVFDACTQELESLGGILDERCVYQPELPFCDLDFETVASDFIAPCADARDDAACTFGLTYAFTQAQAHMTVVHRFEHTLASAQALSQTERDQISAGASAVTGEALDLSGAFDQADAGRINVVELFDLSANVGFTAVEFGSGDTSVGAIFRAGTTERVADIGDGDIFGCSADIGQGGNVCSENADCADGFVCEGRIDDENPVGTPLGLCVGTDAPGNYQDCTSIRDCDEGYCAGVIAFGDWGMCSPGWMFGERSNETVLEADGESVRSDVLVYGQATVPMDLQLTLDLFHDVDPDALTIELLIPGYEGGEDDERPRVTVWPREGVSAPYPTGGRVVLPVLAFGDESINGAWTLRVTDDSLDGASGGVFGWTLSYSSRYD